MKKVMLVTGGTDGIGRETALELAQAGAKVLVHGRSRKKVDAVVDAIRRAGSEAEGLVADFASLEEVRALADEVTRTTDRLDVLVNNAGIYARERKETKDGHESTLQVNHLAPFLLTNLLLPLLEKSAPARIVNVSSQAHHSGDLDLDDLESRRRYSAYGAYAASKLANVLFTFELAERLRGKDVTVNALHPGVINTKLLRQGFGSMGADVQSGARTSVYLATSPDVEGVSGRYFSNAREAHVSSQAQDVAARKRLWALSEGLTGLR